MKLEQIASKYLLLSILSNVFFYIATKIIISLTEGTRSNITVTDYLVFGLPYAFLAYLGYKVIKIYHYRTLSIFVLITLFPLSILELGFLSAATSEALAFGILPLTIFRGLFFCIFFTMFLILKVKQKNA